MAYSELGFWKELQFNSNQITKTFFQENAIQNAVLNLRPFFTGTNVFVCIERVKSGRNEIKAWKWQKWYDFMNVFIDFNGSPVISCTFSNMRLHENIVYDWFVDYLYMFMFSEWTTTVHHAFTLVSYCKFDFEHFSLSLYQYVYICVLCTVTHACAYTFYRYITHK